MTATKRAVAYVRSLEHRSLSEDVEERQTDLIRKFADKTGYQMVDWHLERGPAIEDRPELVRLMNAAKSRNRDFDYMLIWDRSRLTRSAAEYVHIVTELRKAGVEVIEIND